MAQRFSAREEGAAVVEYALALLLIVVVTLTAVSLLGSSLSNFFQVASTSI